MSRDNMAHPASPSESEEHDTSAANRPTASATVALTGVNGLLGRQLLERLARNPRIERLLCLDTKSPEIEDAKISFVDVDLTRIDAQRQVAEALADHHAEVVAHLAFRDGPSPYPGYSHELESIGTSRIVQACLQAKVRKLLMWSRTWVYGAAPNLPALLDESQPALARRSERYLADKIDAERDVSAFRAPGRGRHSTIVRMAPLVDPTVSNHVLVLLEDSRVPSVLGFDPMWQLLHVEDACRALELLLFVDGPAVVNIASRDAIPLSVARRTLGATPLALPRSLAAAMVGGLWLTGAGRIPPSLLDYLQFPCIADCAVARSRLKFVPRHGTLSTLEQAVHHRATMQTKRSPV